MKYLWMTIFIVVTQKRFSFTESDSQKWTFHLQSLLCSYLIYYVCSWASISRRVALEWKRPQKKICLWINRGICSWLVCEERGCRGRAGRRDSHYLHVSGGLWSGRTGVVVCPLGSRPEWTGGSYREASVIQRDVKALSGVKKTGPKSRLRPFCKSGYLTTLSHKPVAGGHLGTSKITHPVKHWGLHLVPSEWCMTVSSLWDSICL